MALGEDEFAGFEGREDRGIGIGADGFEEEGSPVGGGLVELRRDEGADEVGVSPVDGGEELLVSVEAFEAMGLDGEGAGAMPAGIVELREGGEERRGGEHRGPREEEEPAGIEAFERHALSIDRERALGGVAGS